MALNRAVLDIFVGPDYSQGVDGHLHCLAGSDWTWITIYYDQMDMKNKNKKQK